MLGEHNRLYEPYPINSSKKHCFGESIHAQDREQIIREYDWKNLPSSFTQKWDIHFFILTKDYIKSKFSWHILNGEKNTAYYYSYYEYPEKLILMLSNIYPLWVPEYKNWLVKYNKNNELVMRTSINFPDTKVGIGFFKQK